MNNYEWIKKYRAKLARAWAKGCDDRLAAKSAGISEEELVDKLTEMPELRKLRDDKVDSILIDAQRNIAKAIHEGDKKLSQWYIDRMERRFGKAEVVEEDEEEDIDEFLDNFSAKGDFDEQ